ncbi:MAG: OmpH family outer membrane protein [Porticoccaceae bacterium]
MRSTTMKLSVVLACVLAGSLAATPVLAADKIAVVDIGRAIFSSDVAQARQKQLQGAAEYSQLQVKYDSVAADVQALQKQIEAKRMTMSQEQGAEYQKKMEYLRADYELVARKLQAEVKALQSSIMEELQPSVQASLKELVEQGGITVLLTREAVISASPEMDITDKLVERLNSKTR